MADRRLRRHLSQDEMNRAIGMLHSGLSQRHVANVLGVSQSVVSRMWNRFITTGNVRHLHAGGKNAQPMRFKTCLQTSPGFVWTLPIDVLGYGECQMSILLQFVWQNMIGLAGAQSWFGRE